MKILSTRFKDLKIIQGNTFNDNRCFLREIYRNTFFKKKKLMFWSLSGSKKNVVRGMHLQKKFAQDKLITVLKGAIFDVAVDLRRSSKTYGKYFSIRLSAKNSKSLFIPAGFAHGFCNLGKENLVFYGCSNYWSQKNEVGILWNDADLKIKWPVKKPLVSKKDQNNLSLLEYIKMYK